MVEVKYNGRLGNMLFQYCFGRILAEGLGYKLKADPIPGFPDTAQVVDGHDHSFGYPVQIIAHDYPRAYAGEYAKVLSWKNKNLDIAAVLADATKRKIVINGYFERYEYYKRYKDLIRNNWLKISTPIQNLISPDDVLVNIRRGDLVNYGGGWGYTLPFSHYEKALKIAKYNKVFICTDDPRDPFLNNFEKYKPYIYYSDPISDFYFIMSFNKIIQAQSTFSWWASFLSRANKIYAPIPLIGYWSADYPEVDLKVDDESRYIYIKSTGRESMNVLARKIKRKIISIFGNC